MDEPFNLADFMTDSLCLPSNLAPPTTNMYSSPPFDPYAKFYNEDPLAILGDGCWSDPIEVPEDAIGTPIQEFYRGKNVFITGGTGFLGKGLTEKLIRSIPHIGHIYLLIRGKRDMNCEERFKQLLEDKVFSRMKAEVPNYATKMSAVEGDILQPGLGLSDSDHQMLIDNVNIVIHSAADVRFIESLRSAVASNVLGAQRVLNFAKKLKNLISYVHISTAYSQCIKRVVEEKVPKLSINYKEVLAYIESKTDEELEYKQIRIMQGWPNSYVFTKALCEDMMQEEAKGMPYFILRPSVVVSSMKEPMRGWTDNMYGPTGLLVGMGHGIIHAVHINKDACLDMISVDYVVNCVIAACWSSVTHRYNEDALVFNCVSNLMNFNSWNRIHEYLQDNKDIYPFDKALWYPSAFATKSKTFYKVAHLLLAKIPGRVMDKIMEINGHKPMLRKIYERIDKLEETIVYFRDETWEFKYKNMNKLWNLMDIEDKRLYNFRVQPNEFRETIFLGKLGIKHFYLNEDVTSPSADRKHYWLYWIHTATKSVFGLLFLKLAVEIARVLPF